MSDQGAYLLRSLLIIPWHSPRILLQHLDEGEPHVVVDAASQDLLPGARVREGTAVGGSDGVGG